ncbi:hypothetical protein [Paraburkholderia ferrariae]|uniref:hypothetical protein n=1 Tax=Paraburkholderia ferrariae TaxID=386056 RepID=UPI001FE10B18|nr:hypothetical protein [Paraburkholderia ferrariae]
MVTFFAFAVLAGAASCVAAKALAGMAIVALMATETATDSAVLTTAPGISLNDRSLSDFIDVLDEAAGLFAKCSKTTKISQIEALIATH